MKEKNQCHPLAQDLRLAWLLPQSQLLQLESHPASSYADPGAGGKKNSSRMDAELPKADVELLKADAELLAINSKKLKFKL